ncbi:MAG: hypothetical protein WA126_02230 [Thermodesulfovibrionales bacterium]
MFKKDKNKKQRQSTWSLSMIEELKKYLLYDVIPGQISFFIKERETLISLNVTTAEENISYLGFIPYKPLEDIYFALSTWEREDLTEEYQNYMGYIEILNGRVLRSGEHVPMIRGFIKKGFSFFESLNKMLIESRRFSNVMGLDIVVDFSRIDNIPAEEIFNMICDKKTIKLPIKRVDVFQRMSFE